MAILNVAQPDESLGKWLWQSRHYLLGMAKIDRSFTMQDTPERAQRRFVEDIAPELHRKADLALYKEEPGLLAFSDGIVDPMAPRRDGLAYALLRRGSANRVKIVFESEGSGARVTITGRAAREIRDALDRLGQPGQWPDAGRHPV
jgi:hypothetical protein